MFSNKSYNNCKHHGATIVGQPFRDTHRGVDEDHHRGTTIVGRPSWDDHSGVDDDHRRNFSYESYNNCKHRGTTIVRHHLGTRIVASMKTTIGGQPSWDNHRGVDDDHRRNFSYESYNN